MGSESWECFRANLFPQKAVRTVIERFFAVSHVPLAHNECSSHAKRGSPVSPLFWDFVESSFRSLLPFLRGFLKAFVCYARIRGSSSEVR